MKPRRAQGVAQRYAEHVGLPGLRRVERRLESATWNPLPDAAAPSAWMETTATAPSR